MEELNSVYNYLMGPVDALVAFGGALVGNVTTFATDAYKSLLR